MKAKDEFVVSVFIAAISIGAYLYAFGFADRTILFLYEHYGAGPFDPITTGRYWMFGFVVAGFICFALFIFLITGRIFGIKTNLDWKRIATYIPIPLLISILLIVTKSGNPPLTYGIAFGSAFALIFALLIGISFINDLITNWTSTMKHALIGAGFIPFVIFFMVLELPGKGTMTKNTAASIVALTYLLGVSWFAIGKWIVKKQKIKTMLLLKAIVVMSYLGLPVLHYLMTVMENHPYITSSDNFFTHSILLRFTLWIVIALTVAGANRIRWKQTASNHTHATLLRKA